MTDATPNRPRPPRRDRPADPPANARAAANGDPLTPSEAALQDAIDASIRRQFAPPQLDHLVTPEALATADRDATAGPRAAIDPSPARTRDITTTDRANAGPTATAPRRTAVLARIGRPARVAALIALAAAVALAASLWLIGPDALFAPTPTPRNPLVAFQRNVDLGFEPDWVCETDQEFIDTFTDRLGTGLLAQSDAAAGVELVGLGYTYLFSRKTVAVLARVDGQPVIVFVDRARDVAVDISLPTGGITPHPGLQVHEAQLDGLTLVEVSPFDRPRLLDRFTIVNE